MPTYECPECGEIVERSSRLSSGQTIECPDGMCKGKIGHKNVSYSALENRYDEMDFIPPPRVKKYVARVVGRSSSAPPPPNLKWPLKKMPKGMTYCATLSHKQWTGATSKQIRLAYIYLDVNNPAMQGLIIDFNNANRDTEVRAHFDRCTDFMVANHKVADATEATGEIAAAMGVLSTGDLNGYDMVWGFHKHAGAGIDQIWKNDWGGTQYLIVEAKGPGQSLSSSVWNPTGYDQMEAGWVIDRLARMRSGSGGKLAQEILDALNIKPYKAIQGFGGGSKNYYGAKKKNTSGTPTAELYGCVIEAEWMSNGVLTYKVSGSRQYKLV